MKRGSYEGWREGEEQRAAELWLTGKSAGFIAEVLGKSRSSVLGKISRLGLARKKLNAPVVRTAAMPRPAPQRLVRAPAAAIPNRDPCPRCGVRGDVGCAHVRLPLGFIHFGQLAA